MEHACMHVFDQLLIPCSIFVQACCTQQSAMLVFTSFWPDRPGQAENSLPPHTVNQFHHHRVT